MKIVLTEDRERELRSRVMRGVEALDTVSPEWWTHINLWTLNLKNCRLCVLGQLYGNYMNGLRLFTAALEEHSLLAREHLNCGVAFGPHYGFDHEDRLQREWVDEDDQLERQGLADTDLPFAECHLDLMGEWWADIIAKRQGLGRV